MRITDIIKNRNISSILHFTTTSGLLGILATWAVKSRDRLPKEQYLEHVYKPNASYRKDKDWLDYINLSIDKINQNFFDICANKWHTDKEWCVLSFTPKILTHTGVVFATTNNIHTTVNRGTGYSGLLALYASKIAHWDKIHRSPTVLHRPPNYPLNLPTCSEAEVLYPKELSLNFLDRVFLSTHEQTDVLAGQLDVLECPQINYEVNTSIFTK